MTLYRIDPKTRRIIVSDLTPSIRIPLSSIPYYLDETLTSNKEQAELLTNLLSMNEKLELLLFSTPEVKFRDKDNNVRPSSFSGEIYSKTLTMTTNDTTRFESSPKRLRDVVIIVETYAMLLGESDSVVYPVDVDDTLGFTKIDISTLYFKNATDDSNGKITILGVEE